MEIPKPVWYAVRTVGKFRAGQYYPNSELGVLGRMAVKVGALVMQEPPVPAKRAQKAVKPRKKAVPTPRVDDDGESRTAE